MDVYILDENKNPIQPKTEQEAWQWLTPENKRVDQTEIGDVKISTVFLGLDHGWGSGRPVLFETMVFGGELDQEMWRYHSWDEAVKGHKKAVQKVKEVEND